MPGLGKIASAGLIAAMPELGQVSDNIVAALLGVAPYDDDSGQRRGGRHIKGGRRKVRNLFYMPCLGAATQHNPVLKAFYDRLIAKGKEPKVALMHAQAHRHPQHHDRATPEMGRYPLQSERPRSASAERMPSLKTGERTGSRPSAAGGGGAQRQP